MLLAKDYMEKSFLTLAPKNTLLWALKQFRTNRVRYIPVVENGNFVGLLVERDLRDLLPSVVEENDIELLNQTCVYSVMQDKVISISEDTTILEAAQIMRNNKIGCLPVLKGQKILGMLTENHAIKGLVVMLEKYQAPKE
ncbi:MAG: CBS domain-containing protein [Bacillota bacterium]